MSGGMFAIDRARFNELGGFDADMDQWGGENLEMSFKVDTPVYGILYAALLIFKSLNQISSFSSLATIRLLLTSQRPH